MSSPNPKSQWNQPIANPVSHFKSIPWTAEILSSKMNMQTIVPDRTPISTSESAMVRETMNTADTVRACVTSLRYVKPAKDANGKKVEVGEDPKNPFLEVVALLDLGKGINGFAKTAHGGFYGVVLDEVMGTAAQMQAANGAYTVTLTVNFKKPLFTPCIVVCRGKVVRKEGKKLHLKGSVEDKDGNVLADSTGLWIMMQKDVGRWTVARTDTKIESKL